MVCKLFDMIIVTLIVRHDVSINAHYIKRSLMQTAQSKTFVERYLSSAVAEEIFLHGTAKEDINNLSHDLNTGNVH